MKNRDKLEQYIKKEVDSISYDEQDQMWDEFYSKNKKQLGGMFFGRFTIPFIALSVLMIGVAIYLFPSAENTAAEISQTESINSEQNSTPPKVESSEVTSAKQSDRLIKEKAISEKEIAVVPQSNSSADVNLMTEEKKRIKATKSEYSNSNTQEAFTLKRRTGDTAFDLDQGSIFAQSSEVTIQNLGNDESTQSSINSPLSEAIVSDDVSQESTQSSIPSQLSDPIVNKVDSPELNQSSINDSHSSKLNEVKTPLKKVETGLTVESQELKDSESPTASNDKNSKSLLISKLKLKALSKKLGLNKYDGYGKIYATASRNEIYQTGIEFGGRQKISKNWGFGIGIGASFNDGYSFSQDSIIQIRGVVLKEIKKNLDLDYLVNSNATIETFFMRKNLSLGLGITFIYSIYNTVDGRIEESNTFVGTGSTRSGSNFSLSNHWNGMNRFAMANSFSIYYRIKKYEISTLVSLRDHKLIKGNAAQRRKSNVPFQFGLGLSYYP